MILAASYDELLAALLAGAVGVMPTDTVYGLVARAHDKAAAARLYSLKNREHKPGPIIAANTSQFKALGVPSGYLALAERFWPGAISIVLPHSHAYLHQGRGDQPFRIPADERLRRLLERTGPLLTTSANRPTEPVAVTVSQARAYFGDKVDFYMDGGDLSDRPSSTIIRFGKDGRVEVLRPGAVAM